MPQQRDDSPFDDAVNALGSRDRRRLLVALLEHNPQAEVTVPEEVQAGERDLDDLHTAFFHRHLPYLEKIGYIEWDKETHTVVKGPQFDEIRPLLELIDEHRDELPDGWL